MQCCILVRLVNIFKLLNVLALLSTTVIVNQNVKPIILAFTSSPDYLNEDDKQFYIDESLIIDVTEEMELPFYQLKISEGVISYDPNIGLFG